MQDAPNTLVGLESTGISRRAEASCKDLVKVHIAALGRSMYRCKEYVDRDQLRPEEGAVSGLAVFSTTKQKRRRGRPKGTTVSDGAKRPKVPQCDYDTVDWVKIRRFGRREWRCRCNTEGNHNYVPNEVCEKMRSSKPR